MRRFHDDGRSFPEEGVHRAVLLCSGNCTFGELHTMNSRLTTILAIALVICTAAMAQPRVRKPVANGPMYPEKREDILNALQRFYGSVTYTPPQEKLIAQIVPHSAWGFCGEVDATAFKELKIGQYERVIVLAPSHAYSFEGLSIPAVQGFAIPLGLIPTEGSVIGKLNYSAQISIRALNYSKRNQFKMHETEHSIENILPFLLERLGPFYLLPIMVGSLRETNGHLSPGRIEAAADSIREVMDDKTLLVVSTDFTHFGNDFSYRPFSEDIQNKIEALDREAFRLVLSRDFDGFIKYLEQTKNPICGDAALLILMKLLPPQARGEVLAYTQSQMKTKRPERSVSYAAINFYDPTQPPRPSLQTALPGGDAAPAPKGGSGTP